MSKLIALTVLGLTLGACHANTQSSTFVAANHAPVLQPRPATSVDMFWGDEPARPFRYLRQIVVELDHGPRLDESARRELLRQVRADGAQHGCDAVVLNKDLALSWAPGRVTYTAAIAQQVASCLQYTDTRS
jgi:hypothetical protein